MTAAAYVLKESCTTWRQKSKKEELVFSKAVFYA
jgi:hypothetical protein